MDLAAYVNGLRAASAEILASLEPEGTKYGGDAAALVEQRVVSTGETAEGGQLSPYSTKPVPAFFYFNRSRNQRGEAAVRKKAKDRQGLSYSEFRDLNGLNTTPKNLQFTGRMWEGFGVVDVVVLGVGIVQVEIGGKTTYTATLLGYHSDREGTTVSKPSQAEINLAVTGFVQRVQEIINRNLSGI